MQSCNIAWRFKLQNLSTRRNHTLACWKKRLGFPIRKWSGMSIYHAYIIFYVNKCALVKD